MLTLYHFNDATCGIKVRLVLAEKQIQYKEIILTREQMAGPEYRQLNPEGVVPTLVVQAGGTRTVLRESSVIMAYLDELSDTPPLLPELPLDRAKTRWWMKRTDDIYLPALGAATYATIIRQQYLPLDSEKVDKALQSIPDPVSRDHRREILIQGLQSPIVRHGVETLGQMLIDVDFEVQENPFLGGKGYSLADAAITSFFLRCDILGILDLMMPKIPSASSYWLRLKSRPSYDEVVASRIIKDVDEQMRGIAAAYKDQFRAILHKS